MMWLVDDVFEEIVYEERDRSIDYMSIGSVSQSRLEDSRQAIKFNS